MFNKSGSKAKQTIFNGLKVFFEFAFKQNFTVRDFIFQKRTMISSRTSTRALSVLFSFFKEAFSRSRSMTRSWRSRLFLASLIARLSEAGMSSKINTKRGVKIILIGQIYHDDKLEKVCPYNDLEFDNTFYDIFC